MKRTSHIAPVLLVAILAAGTLSVASVFYEVAVGSHGGGAPPQAITVAADAAGGLLAFVLALQLATGLGYFTAAGSQHRLHRRLAWPVLGIVVFHGFQGTLHAFEPPRESATLVLVGIGLVLLVATVVQFRGGRADMVRHAHGLRARLPEHVSGSLLLGGIALAHIVLGTVHAITG